MTSTVPYIGAMMNLLSKSDIRYTGILASVDVEKCSIGLARVRCYGTEGRSATREVPGSDKLHDHIVFKASDIKDLFVIGGGGTTTGNEASAPIDDPAIVSQKAKGAVSQAKEGAVTASSQQSVAPISSATRSSHLEDEVKSRLRRSRTLHEATPGRFVSPPQMLQGRVSDGNDGNSNDDVAGDFDFEEANQRFRQEVKGDDATLEEKLVNPSDESAGAEALYYDKQASFFDSISCDGRAARSAGGSSWMRSMRTNEETFGADSTMAMPTAAPTYYPPSILPGGGAMPYRRPVQVQQRFGYGGNNLDSMQPPSHYGSGAPPSGSNYSFQLQRSATSRGGTPGSARIYRRGTPSAHPSWPAPGTARQAR